MRRCSGRAKKSRLFILSKQDVCGWNGGRLTGGSWSWARRCPGTSSLKRRFLLTSSTVTLWQRSRHKYAYIPRPPCSTPFARTRHTPFLSLVAHQVIELRDRLEIMKVRSAKDRVMLYLDLNAGPDGRTVNLRSQLQDIASELGLTREVLYRTLASLEQTGAIERAGARILLKN